MNPHRDRSCLLLVGVGCILALVWLFTRGCGKAEGEELPPPLAKLAARIEADPHAPPWKKALVPRIRERRIGRFEARITLYCPASPIDPLGGGAWAAWGDIRLRRGHCAVGTRVRAVPLGSVIYCPSVMDHLQVAVDTGPGVNGSDRIDICEPDPERYLALDWANWKRFPCWVLGRVTQREAH